MTLGRSSSTGPLLGVTYLPFGGLGVTTGRFNDFRNVIRGNPCTS
jgi:hypothetical protein